MKIVCNNCGASFNTSENNIWKKAKCKCWNIIEIKKPTESIDWNKKRKDYKLIWMMLVWILILFFWISFIFSEKEVKIISENGIDYTIVSIKKGTLSKISESVSWVSFDFSKNELIIVKSAYQEDSWDVVIVKTDDGKDEFFDFNIKNNSAKILIWDISYEKVKEDIQTEKPYINSKEYL